MIHRPVIIGIAGGIASGKSEVTAILQSLGSSVIIADRIGHSILEDQEVKTLLIRNFGQSILTENSNIINRKQIAKLVFGDSPQSCARRSILEGIVHPPIRQRIQKEIQRIIAEGTAQALVLDIPLLFESHWDKSCDEVWFIDVPISIRLERAIARGWTVEQFRSREASQLSVNIKKTLASRSISNDGTLESLYIKVREALLIAIDRHSKKFDHR